MTTKIHTKDFLAQELRKVGLTAMADRAAEGFYHDFLSPLALPEMQLLLDLEEAAEVLRKSGLVDDHVMALRKRHIDGEFEASVEESEEWAKSDEGQATMAMLSRGDTRKDN